MIAQDRTYTDYIPVHYSIETKLVQGECKGEKMLSNKTALDVYVEKPQVDGTTEKIYLFKHKYLITECFVIAMLD